MDFQYARKCNTHQINIWQYITMFYSSIVKTSGYCRRSGRVGSRTGGRADKNVSALMSRFFSYLCQTCERRLLSLGLGRVRLCSKRIMDYLRNRQTLELLRSFFVIKAIKFGTNVGLAGFYDNRDIFSFFDIFLNFQISPIHSQTSHVCIFSRIIFKHGNYFFLFLNLRRVRILRFCLIKYAHDRPFHH